MEFTYLDLTGLQHNVTETKNYIKAQVAAASSGKLTKQIVEDLPAKGEDDVIYLKKNTSSSLDKNVYDEYIWIADLNSFELIGSTEIDLSQYVKKTTTINTKPLSDNVVLSASDVQALPADTAFKTVTVGSASAADIKGTGTITINAETVGAIPASKESTFETSAHAAETYLTQEDAEDTYQPKGEYLTSAALSGYVQATEMKAITEEQIKNLWKD